MSRKPILAAAAAALAVAGLAAGAANASAFQNGGFELGTFTPDGNGAQNVVTGTMPGWSFAGVGDVSRDLNGAFGVPGDEGAYFLDLTGYCDLRCGLGGWGGVAQTFDTVANATYTVTFDLGTNSSYAGDGSGLVATAGVYTGSFLNNDAVGHTPTVWDAESFQFTATGTSTTLTFIGNRGQAFVGLDKVGVTFDHAGTRGPGGVPEPASWALMIVGFGGVGAALRGRRKGAFAAA
jgi:hypothetical protein